MRFETRFLVAATALFGLASCGGSTAQAVSSAGASSAEWVGDQPILVGEAFAIEGVQYVPADTALYDEVGLATGFGTEHAGQMTANGEAYVPAAITAAHKTLPLPSYVEVTALDTGRTILVRINDRGPMRNDRLIHLSEGAMRQLGAEKDGFGVRIRRVNPPQNDRSVLRAGQAAAVRMDTPESLLKVLRDKLARQAIPAAATVAAGPVAADAAISKEAAPAEAKLQSKPGTASAAAYVVQIAAFASRGNAETLAKKMGASVSSTGDGKLYRVRFGPFMTEKEAQSALGVARRQGYPQARLLRDQL